MIPFIRMTRDKTSIIDLRKTMVTLNNSYKVANSIAEKGGKFLFVGTNKFSSEAVKLNAERAGQFYVDHR
jgi:small subunit ribosomal protein S2